jgi:multimeric flavodoxin WrbA
MTGEAPHVLCIAGSPRRHGNSEQLLDALSVGVQAGGGIASKLVAVDSGVSFCRGCNACSRDGRCIQRDGMDAVYELLDGADAIAVATPVFFGTVPASLKALLDRCQPYWARRYVLNEPRPPKRRPGAVLVVGGGGDSFGTSCAVAPVRSVFAVLSVTASGERVLAVVGPDKSGDVACEPAALERAKSIGVELVEAVLAAR